MTTTYFSGGYVPESPREPMLPNETYLAAQHGWQGGPGGHRRPTNRVLVAVLVGLAVLAVLLGAGVFVQRSNLLPAGVPLIGKDSGVAACQAIASGKKPVAASGKDKMTLAEYRQARAVFSDSRYPSIRDNGVRLIDLAWQLQGLGENPGLEALAFVGSLTEAYTGLAGGCADRGYAIPALTAL